MTNRMFYINESLSFNDIQNILDGDLKLALSPEAEHKVRLCRNYLENKIKNSDAPFYGINTGFGSLCNTQIPDYQLSALQENLVLSHACGTGEVVPDEIVKLMLLLKIQSLSYGYSAIRMETLELLIQFFNLNLLPKVFDTGSLGASGDLAPLAHLSLPLLGYGELKDENRFQPAAEVLAKYSLKPLKLEAKEGLALLNGTQFMSAYGTHILMASEKMLSAANSIAALSAEAYNCRIDPFEEAVHRIRKQSGQAETASVIRKLLQGSEIIFSADKEVQDPYSFRCVPQVHGASSDAIRYVKSVFENENESVTDNPIVVPEEGKIISGGNFHGQPLAISLDFLCIALSELGSISERRIYRMIAGKRGLPPYLAVNAGLNSGFMIVQYTAAAIASRNKQLCTPASADSIESSNGQEDHVSMGANAAVKALQVLKNVQTILALELFSSAQALDFRKPLKASVSMTLLMNDFRKIIPFAESDKLMHDEIVKAEAFVRGYHFANLFSE